MGVPAPTSVKRLFCSLVSMRPPRHSDYVQATHPLEPGSLSAGLVSWKSYSKAHKLRCVAMDADCGPQTLADVPVLRIPRLGRARRFDRGDVEHAVIDQDWLRIIEEVEPDDLGGNLLYDLATYRHPIVPWNGAEIAIDQPIQRGIHHS